MSNTKYPSFLNASFTSSPTFFAIILSLFSKTPLDTSVKSLHPLLISMRFLKDHIGNLQLLALHQNFYENWLHSEIVVGRADRK
jgi:hypothetical protein